MTGFTHDGQAKAQMIQERDQRFGISSAQEKKDRNDIPMPQVQAGANSWQSGRVVQLVLQEMEGTKPPALSIIPRLGFIDQLAHAVSPQCAEPYLHRQFESGCCRRSPRNAARG